jgi:hypothetical protein
MIKITTQVPTGSTTTWYGPENTIPQSYIAMKGQLVGEYNEYAKLVELFPVSLPDTRTANSVVIIKAYDFTELGEDFSNRYYGPHSEDPVLNLSGGVPVPGDCYYNTPNKELRYFNGSKWESIAAGSRYLVKNADSTVLLVNRNNFIAEDGTYFLPVTWNMEIGDYVNIVTKYNINNVILKVNNDTTDSIKLSTFESGSQVDLTGNSSFKFIYIGSNQWQVSL